MFYPNSFPVDTQPNDTHVWVWFHRLTETGRAVERLPLHQQNYKKGQKPVNVSTQSTKMNFFSLALLGLAAAMIPDDPSTLSGGDLLEPPKFVRGPKSTRPRRGGPQ